MEKLTWSSLDSVPSHVPCSLHKTLTALSHSLAPFPQLYLFPPAATRWLDFPYLILVAASVSSPAIALALIPVSALALHLQVHSPLCE